MDASSLHFEHFDWRWQLFDVNQHAKSLASAFGHVDPNNHAATKPCAANSPHEGHANMSYGGKDVPVA